MTEQAPQVHSLRVKLGGAEFEATGTEESVKSQYQLFLDAIKGVGGNAPPRQPVVPVEEEQPIPPNLVDEDPVLGRLFSLRDDVVTLNALPTGDAAEADALLVLLWGFERIQRQSTVGAVRLMKAARASGVPVPDRIDRTLASVTQYVLRSGSRKGTRYTLNNPGRARALQIVQGMFQ